MEDALTVGWTLKFNCQSTDPVAQSTVEATSEYRVRVSVVDTDHRPVAGAKVTLHSVVQEAVTDDNGIAQFHRVAAGEHRVIIAYNGYEGEQSIDLSGDVKEFSIKITIEPKTMKFSSVASWMIGGTSIVLGLLGVWWMRRRRLRLAK